MRSPRLAIVTLAASLALTVGGLFLMRNRVTRPLTAITGVMTRFAAHDFASEVPGLDRNDEIGRMASALQVFKDAMINAERLSGDQAAERAAKEQRASEMSGLVRQFESRIGQMVQTLSSASGELETTARSMSGTAAEAQTQAGDADSAQQTVGAGDPQPGDCVCASTTRRGQAGRRVPLTRTR